MTDPDQTLRKRASQTLSAGVVVFILDAGKINLDCLRLNVSMIGYFTCCLLSVDKRNRTLSPSIKYQAFCLSDLNPFFSNSYSLKSRTSEVPALKFLATSAPQYIQDAFLGRTSTLRHCAIRLRSRCCYPSVRKDLSRCHSRPWSTKPCLAWTYFNPTLHE